MFHYQLTMNLKIGDLVCYELTPNRYTDSTPWVWVGHLKRVIKGGEWITPDEVIDYYGPPKQDSNGWYTSYALKGWTKDGRPKDESKWRKNDWKVITRRYRKWECLNNDRLIFEKVNGHTVVMPPTWVTPLGFNLTIRKWVGDRWETIINDHTR